jgi:hypothetical protein
MVGRSELCAMRWDEAMATARRIEGPNQLVVSALSYHYLKGGPAFLTDRERVLRRVIARIPAGETLPANICRDLLAWRQAIHIARRRSRWDLPASWFRQERDAE